MDDNSVNNPVPSTQAGPSNQVVNPPMNNDQVSYSENSNVDNSTGGNSMQWIVILLLIIIIIIGGIIAYSLISSDDSSDADETEVEIIPTVVEVTLAPTQSKPEPTDVPVATSSPSIDEPTL